MGEDVLVLPALQVEFRARGKKLETGVCQRNAIFSRQHRVESVAASGNVKAREMVTYFVGQGVGLTDSVKSCRTVVGEFMEDFAEAVTDMSAWLKD